MLENGGESVSEQKHFLVQDVTSLGVIFSQPVFPLNQESYSILKSRESRATQMAAGAFAGTISYALSFLIKVIASWISHQNISITIPDEIGIAIPFCVGAIAWAIGWLLPDKRKNLCKKIDSHFKENPGHYHLPLNNR